MDYKLEKITGKVYDYYYTDQPLIWVELYFNKLTDFNDRFFDKYRNDLFYNSNMAIYSDRKMVRMRVLYSDYENHLLKHHKPNLFTNIISKKEDNEISNDDKVEILQGKIKNEIDELIKRYDLGDVPDVVRKIENVVSKTSANRKESELYQIRFESYLIKFDKLKEQVDNVDEIVNWINIMNVGYNEHMFTLCDNLYSILSQGKKLRSNQNEFKLLCEKHPDIIRVCFDKSKDLQTDAFKTLVSMNSKPEVRFAIEQIKDAINNKNQQEVDEKEMALAWITSYNARKYDLELDEIEDDEHDMVYSQIDYDEEFERE